MDETVDRDVFDFMPKPEGVTMGYKCEPGFKDEPRHTWWIKGQEGGVHIWARISRTEGWPPEWIGGVECHWASCPDGGWHKPEAPSHDHCWLLDGPCWHDGTSLYFRERIAPRLPWPDAQNPHDADAMPIALIGHILADWFDDKIKDTPNDQDH